LGELAALAAAFLWSTTSAMLAGLVIRIPAALLSFVRLTLAVPAFALILLVTGGFENIVDAGWRTAVLMACSGALGYGVGDSLYIYSLGKVGLPRSFPVAQAGFTLLTFLGSVILLDEPVTWVVAAGSVFVLAGVYLVVTSRRLPVPVPEAVGALQPGPVRGGAPVEGSGLSVAALSGWFALAGTSVAWAGATLLLRAESGPLDAYEVGALRVPAAVLVLGAFVGFGLGRQAFTPFRNRRRLAAVCGASWLGSVVGGSLYIFSVQEAGAARAAVLSATAPLLAMPLAIFVLKDRPTRRVVVGTVVSIVGIALVV
jgi:drug/metabolite transporter (DMT)-like permease